MPSELQPNIIIIAQCSFSVFLLDPTQIQFHLPPEKKKKKSSNIDEEARSIVKFNYSTKSVSMFFSSNVPESLVARKRPGDENLINIFTFYDATFL